MATIVRIHPALSTFSGSLGGLQWLLPIIGTGGSGYGQTVASITVTDTATFSPGVVFNVTLRLRGVVETKDYAQPSTTIASLSNNVSLPAGTINVIDATSFPSSGAINVVSSAGLISGNTDWRMSNIKYTSKTSTSFLGCSGGTGTMATGYYVGSGLCSVGGTPSGSDWNLYRLTISNPSQTYYLNNGPDNTFNCWSIDYTQVIQVRGGATVTLFASAIDSGPYEIYNSSTTSSSLITPISIPGIISPTQPYNGQFIQMDVISVSA